MIKKKKKGKEEVGKKFLDKKGTYLVETSAVAAKFRLRATTARIGTLTAMNPVEAWRPDVDWMWNSPKLTPQKIKNIFE